MVPSCTVYCRIGENLVAIQVKIRLTPYETDILDEYVSKGRAHSRADLVLHIVRDWLKRNGKEASHQ